MIRGDFANSRMLWIRCAERRVPSSLSTLERFRSSVSINFVWEPAQRSREAIILVLDFFTYFIKKCPETHKILMLLWGWCMVSEYAYVSYTEFVAFRFLKIRFPAQSYNFMSVIIEGYKTVGKTRKRERQRWAVGGDDKRKSHFWKGCRTGACTCVRACVYVVWTYCSLVFCTSASAPLWPQALRLVAAGLRTGIATRDASCSRAGKRDTHGHTWQHHNTHAQTQKWRDG